MLEARFYSLRQLGPYQGTVQVVELPGFRAMSPDGLTWQVQFHHERVRLSMFGTWRADGSGDVIETDRTRPFLEVMRSLPPFPFPLADRVELWLLDAENFLPLALLASTQPGRALPKLIEPKWEPTLAQDESFFATSLSVAGSVLPPPVAHRDVLKRCVRKAAGALGQAQWFARRDDGSGAGLHGCRLDDRLLGRELDGVAFPELLVREDWASDREERLVRDYHDWQAPNLLTHDRLTRATRDRLERAACHQATRLYRLRHLLPEIVNRELVQVAMVEAVMRRAVPA
jgi:hypothetical protein